MQNKDGEKWNTISIELHNHTEWYVRMNPSNF